MKHHHWLNYKVSFPIECRIFYTKISCGSRMSLKETEKTLSLFDFTLELSFIKYWSSENVSNVLTGTTSSLQNSILGTI